MQSTFVLDRSEKEKREKNTQKETAARSSVQKQQIGEAGWRAVGMNC